MNTIKIPTRFYNDHCERGLPAPEIMKETKLHYWVDADSEHLAELLSDADFYSVAGDWDRELFGLCMSARATADAIRSQKNSRVSGPFDQEYQIYLDLADDGKGIDITTGRPLKTYDEWLNS